MLRITLVILSTLLTGFLVRPDTVVPSSRAYPEQLPDALTGGFGEETCRSCHFDYPLNYKEGGVNITGIPSSYEAGKTYTFTIEISRENLGKAGFQLTARFADSTQAGAFSLESNRTQFTNLSGDIQYVQHSPEGTKPNGPDSSDWSVTWTAPEQSEEKVIFNLAANAANGDASAFGDFIYTREIESVP